MEYEKSISGSWIDADKVVSGTKAKLVSEVVKQDSKFKGKDGNTKTENIGKIRLQGSESAVNIRVNWSSIYALIDAFGKDSKDWIGKLLTIKTLDAMVGDTMRTIIYLIPEGFELKKNEEKKMVIVKVGDPEIVRERNAQEIEEEINIDETPF